MERDGDERRGGGREPQTQAAALRRRPAARPADAQCGRPESHFEQRRSGQDPSLASSELTQAIEDVLASDEGQGRSG